MAYNNRTEYLRNLSDEYDVPVDVVFAVADILGENEDYDGLINMLEDYEYMF